MSDIEAKTLKMWSDKFKKDMWWVENGDFYIGPFVQHCDAEDYLNQLNIE